MERAIKIFLIVCVVSFICGSCSKESDSDSSSYQITYTLKGPATTAQVQYTPTITDPYNIPDNYEEIVSVPWQKTVTLIDAVGGAGFSVSIDGGIPGAKYQMSILGKDGSILKDGELVLDNEGNGVFLINYYK
ncbi:hypothetical protein ABE545_18135 [Sphingobacterium faecium]|uniref:hypothetical protein n=1 Tax=Sphingobacterium faecium TaxID=34087 RepID=UPI003208A1E3